jgi:hypothetical protein
MMILGLVPTISFPVFAADPEPVVREPINYLTHVFNTAEEKLETMTKRVEAFGYELYYEDVSGETAIRDTKTGQVMFSNPYSVGAMTGIGSDDTKNQLLSQVIVRYTDNDQEKNYYSYVEAAQRSQIIAKNIKNGLRVEYTIGKEETRNLVPMLIEKTRFDEQILANIDDEQALKKISAFYTLKDPDDPKLTVRGVMELKATFKITEKMAVYVFDPYASQREINLIEGYIKLYCPEYTFAALDEDHAMTEYEGAATAPALFKMALEYYLNDDGLEVRLPANGIRFDESTYQLNYIQILPYIGAGSYDNTGYTFIPDGSGTIIRFEDFKGQPVTIAGKIYGQDFAYHQLSGAHQQVMRLPVFGVVENYKNTYTKDEEVEVTADDGTVTIETVPTEYTVEEDRGYVAIIKEGDGLANIMTAHGGSLHKYATVYTQFNPRPKDSYNLAEAISVGANAMWTVVSKRKYTGSYRIQYIMLNDSKLAAANGLRDGDYYETSWVGMAKAYRDYLVAQGDITPITSADVKSDIPLYVESFGVVDETVSILSFPVSVKTPLTTFENLKTMYDELSAGNLTNIVFRIRGFANGGMWYGPPTKVKFEKNVGGNDGYKEFLEYADSKGIKVYPDFDFVYVDAFEDVAFSGVSARNDYVKTIDNRYAVLRNYSPVMQDYWRGGYYMAISPSVYSKFLEKFEKAFNKLGFSGLSVSTLGSYLNSDFDKKDPYNREDSKEYTVRMLDALSEEYGKVMTDSGNSFTFKYASSIMNVPLDSSRYYYSSQAVPFMGMVLHGYIPFAGTPTNMAGDINYEILKIIENGASPYFTLSYQNTSKLKDLSQDLAKYYSISYEIWHDDLITKYNIMNEALADTQTATIEQHEFIANAERIPSADEIAADRAAAAVLAAAEAEATALKEAKDAKAKLLAERLAEAARQEAIANGETPAEVTAPTEEVATIVTPEEAVEEAAGYVANKYTCALGTVVRVTYSNGASFILNYNSYDITAAGQTVGPLNFVRIG